MMHFRGFRPAVFLLGALALGACKEEEGEPPRLFDETGAWSLIRYDIEGEGNLREVSASRENAFMLSFDRDNAVVTAAACESESGSTPTDSLCDNLADNPQWVCSCYGYVFEEDTMKWVEFAAGNAPPVVTLEDDEGMPAADGAATMGGSGGADDDDDDDDDDMASGPTLVITSALGENVMGTYNFRPLPATLFGSDGTVSRYVFQTVSATVFDRAFSDPDRPGCTPCI